MNFRDHHSPRLPQIFPETVLDISNTNHYQQNSSNNLESKKELRNGIGAETHPGLPNPKTDETGTVNKEGKSFFEIAPQELRDLIYDATFHHEAKRGHFTSNFEALCLHLRLVSRQFKDEYDKQTPKRTKLVLCFDADIVPLRSRRLSTFVPALATRCTLIELRYLAHKFQLFDGYGERSQNFAAFSALCMGLVMSMTHLRGLEIRLIWDSVSVLEDFATECRRTSTMNTCVTTALRSLLFAESYLSRRDAGSSNSSGSVINFKLQYRGLASTGPAGGLDSDVSGIELLEEPAILGFWSDQHNYFLMDEEATRERLMVEVAIQAKKITIETVKIWLASVQSSSEGHTMAIRSAEAKGDIEQ